tara:strand:+ start:1598 stop:2686 length:1089 start_codon:yes stop_codon:yes gene_type:complete
MNICIIGMNLTSLILSKALINIGCSVDIFAFNQKKSNFSTRTIGISRSNINFINKNIITLNAKQFQNIKKIKILSHEKKEIINFYNKDKILFSITEVNKLFDTIYNKLKSNKFFKINKLDEKNFDKKNFINNYSLVINCEKNNFISRKYFSKKFKKKYDSLAYTSLIYHKKIKNFEAKQYFTNYGPLAFLPLSSATTSVVFSAYNLDKSYDKSFKELVLNFAGKLKINKFSDYQKAELNFSLARKYYFKNVLLFGDGLHQIHPLAGQGFNMTIRDLKIFIDIIKNKVDYGLEIDASCLKEFEEVSKSKNFIFSEGINFIQDFFRIKNSIGDKKLTKLVKKIGENNKLKNFFIKVADQGITIS